MDRISGEMTGQIPPTQEGSDVDSSDQRARPISVQNENLNAIIQKLSVYLKAPPRGLVSTAPAGFDEALQGLGSSDSISRAFQSQGFWSWLAYFLATKDYDQFDGLSQTLSGIPPNILSEIAGHVSRVEVELSLIQRIEHTLWIARRGAQRRGQLRQAGIRDFPPEPSAIPSSLLEPDSRKRPRAQSLDRIDDPTGVTERPISHNMDMVSDILQEDTVDTVHYPTAGQPTEVLQTLNNTSRPMFNIDPRYNYAYPNASNIPSVFESDLGDMIVRNGYNASILVSIPPDPTQCRLVLDVEAPAVVPLAMKLYGAQIVEIEQQRAFRLPSGACMGIMGAAKLTRTKVRLWDELLGELVITGVRHSQEHLNEVMQGIVLSKCLSMEIPGAAGRPARISLTMDEFILVDIINKLWP
ncbi:hypothetical protein FNYG_02361 [Fusarium nygamai]|uniref:Uncharacterized protein n=1 Tax=Gibberella nygamai TaxID=42673 RepID=A0A2K0WPU2_GIBNY|nr:hypothetical protein FNYG_02361 [Fusarium nygamai]